MSKVCQIKQRIEQAIELFREGAMLVVTDDNARENEGDLIVAAQHCTTEQMAMMIRHTSGIICVPMAGEIAERLQLAPMVQSNSSAYCTAFTISVDYKHDSTTGISAYERAVCANKLADPTAMADDFVRPGHIFPLLARQGGVLLRAGHTEAAVDLCLLAGLMPVAVIGELMNDDGSVKHGESVAKFSRENNLTQITIEDLIFYRQVVESLAHLKHQDGLVEYYEVVGVDGQYKVRLAKNHSPEVKLYINCPVAAVDENAVEITTQLQPQTVKAYDVAHERYIEWANFGALAQILRDLKITACHLEDTILKDKYKEIFSYYGIVVT